MEGLTDSELKYPRKSLIDGSYIEYKIIASVQNKNINSLPIINFEINGCKINALCDSGAAVSLSSPSLFEQLKNTGVKYKNLSNHIKIQTLTNSTIAFKQCVKLTFRLENIFVSGAFFVTNRDFGRDYNMLLGFDFLKTNKIILDFEDKTMKLKNKNIALHFSTDETQGQINNVTPSTVNLNNNQQELHNNEEFPKRKKKKRFLSRKNIISAKISQTTEILPDESMIIELICPDQFISNDTIILEPIKHKINIQYETSIHEIGKDNKINIIVKNNSQNKIILTEGMNLGKISKQFEIQSQIDNEEQNTYPLAEINNLNLEEVREKRKAELSPDDFKLEHLDCDTKAKLEEILLNNAYAFSKNYDTLGQCSLVVPRINLSHNYPIQAKPYKLAHNVKEYARQEIDKLLKANIIKKSNSDYAFPVVFVKKKAVQQSSGQVRYRLAVDYRVLNEILQNYAYPIPDIKQILRTISGKKFYSVLDLHSAFYQINLREEDTEKLAFITECGKFSFLRLPFGTRLSTAVFSELMDTIFAEFDKSQIAHFIDDIILATDSLEEMLDLLDKVLKVFIQHNLTVEPSKIQLCMQEIEFLGFTLHSEGYSPSKRNIDKIQNLVRPTNKKGVKSLLGLSNYFRSLIKDYSKIVDPLIELTKEKVKFKWSDREENAFKEIQNAIMGNPTLKPPDFSKDFILITDASKTAISGILGQEYNGVLVPIEYFGRKLKSPEKNYPSFKLELLAIHEAVMFFKYILAGRKFVIRTDSKALTYHLNLEKQPDIIARWIDDLAPFNYEIEYLPGSSNPADYISRNINNITAMNDLQNSLFVVNKALADDNIKIEQTLDEKLGKIISKIKNNKQNKYTRKFILNNKDILILKPGSDGKELLIAPEKLKLEIIQDAHKPHFGFNKTYHIVKTRFFWHGMYKDVREYCVKCVPCNTTKQHQTIKVPTQKIIKDKEVGSALNIDILGLLPMTLRKHKFIFTIIDSTSRFLEAVPVRNCETQTLLNVLNGYFGRYGLPRSINLDNGRYFNSDTFKQYMKSLNIELKFSSVHHPQSNSLVEISNKILKNSITAMSRSSIEWDVRLDYFKLYYNSSRHRSTGVSPSLLFFGREIINPFSVHLPTQDINMTTYVQNRITHIQEIKKLALQNQEKVSAEYVNNDKFQKVKFLKIGQECYLKCIGKPGVFQPKWLGPFEVTRKLRNNNYLLKEKDNPDKSPIKRHISKLFSPTKVESEIRQIHSDSEQDDQE